jgi:hypothetical protein
MVEPPIMWIYYRVSFATGRPFCVSLWKQVFGLSQSSHLLPTGSCSNLGLTLEIALLYTAPHFLCLPPTEGCRAGQHPSAQVNTLPRKGCCSPTAHMRPRSLLSGWPEPHAATTASAAATRCCCSHQNLGSPSLHLEPSEAVPQHAHHCGLLSEVVCGDCWAHRSRCCCRCCC